MFYGEYRHNLDRKGRIIMPAKLRDVCKEYAIDKFFLTRGLDKCIFMFTEDEWRLQESKFRSMPFTKQETRHFNRMFFAGAVDVRPDKQGRFIIPDYLKEHASIKKETIIIGVSNRIEIWDRQSWSGFAQGNEKTFEEVAENIINL